MKFTSLIIPLILVAVLIYGLFKGVNVFDEFISGAKEGLTTSVKILPALIALMTCVGMFKVSGGLDIISFALKPLITQFNIPAEVVPLGLLRPISGSGALALFKDIIEVKGADSYAGRVASVLMGSSETTFYTIALYYGAYKIDKTRHTVLCALSADIVCFFLSALLIQLLF